MATRMIQTPAMERPIPAYALALAGGLAAAGLGFGALFTTQIVVAAAALAVGGLLAGSVGGRWWHVALAWVAASAPAGVAIATAPCRTGDASWMLAGLIGWVTLISVVVPVSAAIGVGMADRVASWQRYLGPIAVVGGLVGIAAWVAILGTTASVSCV